MKSKRIILIGDSIRMGYQSRVRAAFEGRAVVTAPKENCGNTFWIRENLDKWVISHKPDVVHFNAGIHDLGWMPGETNPRFSISEYARSLRIIVDRLRGETDASLIFATTTPILKPCSPSLPKEQCRSAEIVDRYNAAAVKVMAARDVAVNDLNQVVHQAGLSTCICDDKIHMADDGNDVLAAAVVRAIEKHL
jgi:lysophospholipase L1-like esterase